MKSLPTYRKAVCTPEEQHRSWFLDNADVHHPRDVDPVPVSHLPQSAHDLLEGRRVEAAHEVQLAIRFSAVEHADRYASHEVSWYRFKAIRSLTVSVCISVSEEEAGVRRIQWMPSNVLDETKEGTCLQERQHLFGRVG